MRRTPNARRPRHVGDETLSPDSRLGTSLALLVGQNLFPHQNYYLEYSIFGESYLLCIL